MKRKEKKFSLNGLSTVLFEQVENVLGGVGVNLKGFALGAEFQVPVACKEGLLLEP